MTTQIETGTGYTIQVFRDEEKVGVSPPGIR